MNSSDSFDECLKIMWNEFLSESSENIAAILKNCHPSKLEGDTLTVVVPSKFVKDFLKKKERLREITSALRASFNSESINLDIIVETEKQTAPKGFSNEQKQVSLTTDGRDNHSVPDLKETVDFSVKSEPGKVSKITAEEIIAEKSDKKVFDSNIQPDLTFENFVCSTNNEVARTTSLAVAQSPGKMYNPLFLYSGVGLGKTHLMNAIGNYIKINNPELKIIYISAEQFINEFIESISIASLKSVSAKAFRDKFRSVDILLIDDIHVIIGKDAVQEELFQTIDTLLKTKRQVVVSSDRPPKQLKTIIDRLQSRFAWSMVADIQPPDLETRIAILRQKTNKMDIDIKDDVLNYIASEFHSNIRELEGALTRTIAYCSIHKIELNIQNAKTALQDLLDNSKIIKIDANKIKKAVCEYFNITEDELMGPRRDQRIVRPRQIAMYLCKEMASEMSYPEIGNYFGGRDHTTAIHSCRKVEENLNETFYRTSINNIKERLK